MLRWIAALLFLCTACEGGGSEASGALSFGEAAAPDLLASWDTAIPPDGVGLPSGSGNTKDGRSLYQTHCLACHGAGGTGGPAGDLVGGHGSIGGAAPRRTVGSYWPYATTLFDYIRRAMPYDRPGSLSSDEVYALVAYVLAENDIIGRNDSLDAATLPAVRMPNRDGFPAQDGIPTERSRRGNSH